MKYTILPITKDNINEVLSWAEKRGTHYDLDCLSNIGFMIPEIAAFFVYTTNSHVVYLENLISNPDQPKEITNEAIKELVSFCLVYAKALKAKKVISITNHPRVIARAKEHNAQIEPNYNLLTINFKKD